MLLLLNAKIPAMPEILLSRQQIAVRVAELGQQITADFAGQSVLLIGVLKGACMFLGDLARQICPPCAADRGGLCRLPDSRPVCNRLWPRLRRALSQSPRHLHTCGSTLKVVLQSDLECLRSFLIFRQSSGAGNPLPA